MLRLSSFFCVLAVISLTACAQSVDSHAPKVSASNRPIVAPQQQTPKVLPEAAENRIKQALMSVDPNVKLDYIGQSPFPGFAEVLVQGQLLFITEDGRYLLQAQPLDLQTKQLYRSQAQLAYRRSILQQIPAADRIVFSPPNPKYTVTVFTDIECGYCRKLHSEIAQYNQRGIAVEYVAFPRAGLVGENFQQMAAVWCAKDRKDALTKAKMGETVAEKKDCASPVAMEYNTGLRLGVNGTPAIYTADGSQIGGYLSPDQMLAVLARHETAQAR